MPGTVATNYVGQSPVLLVKPNGVTRSFGYGATSDTARGTALLAAVTAASSGDTIKLGPGEFDIQTGHVVIPAGSTLCGDGMYSTRITSQRDLLFQGVIVNPNGANCVIRDLSIIGNATAGPGLGKFQACIGATTTEGDNVFTDLEVLNCYLSADTDCYYVSSYTTLCTAVLRDCVLRSNYDCVMHFRDDIECVTHLYDCDISAVGPTNSLGGDQIARGVSAIGGTIYVHGGSINAQSAAGGGSATNIGVYAVSPGTVILRGVAVTSSGTGTVNDLSGPISVDAATTYSTSSGTITKLKFHGATPGATGLALIDDTTASGGRDTLGATSGVFPVAAGGTGFGTAPTGVLKGASGIITTASAGTDYLAPAAIGVTVQGYDADLAAIAGLTSAADKGIQFTGSGTAGTYDLTTAGKAILDDADAAAQRATLGVNKFWDKVYTTGAFNPADATTYYIVITALTVSNYQRHYPSVTGTITRARILINNLGTIASNEANSIYIRLNDTTDYTLTTSLAINNRNTMLDVTGLSIPISASTDFIEMKWITPTWATNPTNLVFTVYYELTY